jgi:hypothetical protein
VRVSSGKVKMPAGVVNGFGEIFTAEIGDGDDVDRCDPILTGIEMH